MPEWLAPAWEVAEKAGPLATIVVGFGWWSEWRGRRASAVSKNALHAAEIHRMTEVYKDTTEHLQATNAELLKATLGRGPRE